MREAGEESEEELGDEDEEDAGGGTDPRYEHYENCLVACLWMGDKVVAAAVLRLTLPTPLGAGAAATWRYVEVAATHLQDMFQGTAPWLRRRGLGLLLMQCIMRTAAELGHKYITTLVAESTAAGTSFWSHVGFHDRRQKQGAPEGPEGARRKPRPSMVLREVLKESGLQALFKGTVRYAELPKRVEQGEVQEDGPPPPQQQQQQVQQQVHPAEAAPEQKRQKGKSERARGVKTEYVPEGSPGVVLLDASHTGGAAGPSTAGPSTAGGAVAAVQQQAVRLGCV